MQRLLFALCLFFSLPFLASAQTYSLDGVQSKVVIDVRTPEEYAFIGHAEGVWNVPLAFVDYHRTAGRFEYAPRFNPDFVAEVRKIAGTKDTLLVMCRSGGRSAKVSTET